jgi:phosphate transport system permease protein
VRNQAGVPSIVYGLLGLGIFVKVLDGLGDPGSNLQDNGFVLFRYFGNVLVFLSGHDGRNVFAGGLALSALVLPIVIITASEALRAVPRSIREGALGVGATKWETIRHHVLPAAAPGILTGTVLSLARATGEAAPILLVGATTGTLLTGNQNLLEQLSGGFTALPVVIFSYARQTGDDWRAVTGAAALVLLVLVLVMNGFAIWLRNRYERKW